MTSDQLAQGIIRHASRFVGLREVKPNANWDNPSTPGPDRALVDELRSLMRQSPWEEGWAYCAAFAEGMVLAALRSLAATPTQIKRWQQTMTPHCVTSAGNFRKLGLLSASAEPGSIWLARHGRTSKGHAGLVTTVRGLSMATIEGNTSIDPSTSAKEREGDWITNRIRFLKGSGTLNTLGFVTPTSILKLIGA
ncbi:hypothetical protein [Prosthecobacter sp.]|uniref:hypothetical protein n=1 Tax=Prosthecobacter sp. TaxID=1965333 RepID=UPI001DBA6EB4|nr:hypothetical protein [Prosthecobacter sp.]MCB1275026.1 hypothetical protein [Prosthecobacter sp.]